jgi:type IV pilus assembly protein PilM
MSSAPAVKGSDSLLRRAASGLKRWVLEPYCPLTAIEIRGRSVGVVRLGRHGRDLAVQAVAYQELAPGVLKLSMVEPNIRDQEAFQGALRSVLERAGASAPGPVGLVLPDPVARLALLPSSQLEGSGGGIEAMVRFRLRKAVPFDIENARVDLAPSAAGMVLAVVAFRPVLQDFEEALRALGLNPGLVDLSGLALLHDVERSHPASDRLLVNWDEGYISLFLTQGGFPVLIRTLVDEASDQDLVLREIAKTLTYYREKLGGKDLTETLVRSTALPPDEAVAALQHLGLFPDILNPLERFGPLDGKSAQVVAGAAACLLGRCA